MHALPLVPLILLALGCAPPPEADGPLGDTASAPVGASFQTTPTSEPTTGGTPSAPSTTTRTTSTVHTADTAEAAAVDYSAPGPYAVFTDEGTVSASCSMRYTRFLPDAPMPDTLVVLNHGFVRGQPQMRAWAEQLASWGLAVVTPDLCHLSLLDVDQPANAVDLALLAETLAPGSAVIYAGHSSGGVAALLATTVDDDAVGLFGLDLTDSQEGEGAAAAPGLTVPLAGLVADPEVCNTSNNGLGVYATAPAARALHLFGSDHCDFESPTNALCTLACAEGAQDSDLVRQAIGGLTTSWMLWTSGLDPAGADWWTPGGTWYDQLNGPAFEQLVP